LRQARSSYPHPRRHGLNKRSARAVVSDHWPRHGAVDPHASSAGKRLRDDPTAGIQTKIGNHTFRATGITAYLKNGGTLEKAAMIANRASTRTTRLYDRRNDEVSLDEVERILS